MNDLANVPAPVGDIRASHSLIIDERIRSHVPPLRPEELAQLEENLVSYGGCKDALTAWDGMLLDGHNRYEICNRLGLPYRVENLPRKDLEDAIAWVEDNQSGRRNLTPDQFAYFLGRKYERLNRGHGGSRDGAGRPVSANGLFSSRTEDSSGKSCHLNIPEPQDLSSERAADRLAREHGVSQRTVRYAADFAANVEKIAHTIGDGARAEILSGRDGLTRADVAEIAEVAPDAIKSGLTFSSAKDAMDWVAKERAARAAEKRATNDALKASIVTILPDGVFETIVIDPPWEMEKIDRDVRPNQVAFDYPTMTEEELGKFRLPDMAADDCHLFCWTTQKFLPSALQLIEVWGFRYVLWMGLRAYFSAKSTAQ